jgi:hypothetical protein
MYSTYIEEVFRHAGERQKMVDEDLGRTTQEDKKSGKEQYNAQRDRFIGGISGRGIDSFISGISIIGWTSGHGDDRTGGVR